RRQEILQRFDEIVEFSGLERFLDTPVKRYSSGMQVRLAFAVAAHLQPEILLVDEVLAVRDLCPRSLLLEKGRLVFDGDTDTAFAQYLKTTEADSEALLTGSDLEKHKTTE